MNLLQVASEGLRESKAFESGQATRHTLLEGLRASGLTEMKCEACQGRPPCLPRRTTGPTELFARLMQNAVLKCFVGWQFIRFRRDQNAEVRLYVGKLEARSL
jgi:hypothetical protein